MISRVLTRAQSDPLRQVGARHSPPSDLSVPGPIPNDTAAIIARDMAIKLKRDSLSLNNGRIRLPSHHPHSRSHSESTLTIDPIGSISADRGRHQEPHPEPFLEPPLSLPDKQKSSSTITLTTRLSHGNEPLKFDTRVHRPVDTTPPHRERRREPYPEPFLEPSLSLPDKQESSSTTTLTARLSHGNEPLKFDARTLRPVDTPSRHREHQPEPSLEPSLEPSPSLPDMQESSPTATLTSRLPHVHIPPMDNLLHTQHDTRASLIIIVSTHRHSHHDCDCPTSTDGKEADFQSMAARDDDDSDIHAAPRDLPRHPYTMLRLDADVDSTIMTVKRTLARVINSQPSQMRLVHAGQCLEDESTLREYSLPPGEPIQLLFTKRLYVKVPRLSHTPPRTLTIGVVLNSTIRSVKRAITSKIGIPHPHLHLFFKSRILLHNDASNLTDCHIHSGDTLQLTVSSVPLWHRRGLPEEWPERYGSGRQHTLCIFHAVGAGGCGRHHSHTHGRCCPHDGKPCGYLHRPAEWHDKPQILDFLNSRAKGIQLDQQNASRLRISGAELSDIMLARNPEMVPTENVPLGTVSPILDPPTSQVCIPHAVGEHGCIKDACYCRFPHVDFDSLTRQQRSFINDYVKARAPRNLHPEKMSIVQREFGGTLHRRTFQIFVSGLASTANRYTMTLDVRSTDRVVDLKRMISCKCAVPVRQQRLTYACKPLSNDTLTLRDYNVQKGATVSLALRLLGGARSPPPDDEKAEVEDTDVAIKSGDRHVIVLNEFATLCRKNKIPSYVAIGGAKTALTAGNEMPPMVTDSIIHAARRRAIPMEFAWYNHTTACRQQDLGRNPDEAMILSNEADSKIYRSSICGLPGHKRLAISDSALGMLADLLERPEFLNYVSEAPRANGDKTTRCIEPKLERYSERPSADGESPIYTPPGNRSHPSRTTPPDVTPQALDSRLWQSQDTTDELRTALTALDAQLKTLRQELHACEQRLTLPEDTDPPSPFEAVLDKSGPAIAATLRAAVHSHLSAVAWDVRRGYRGNGLAPSNEEWEDLFTTTADALISPHDVNTRSETLISTVGDLSDFESDSLDALHSVVETWVGRSHDDNDLSAIDNFANYQLHLADHPSEFDFGSRDGIERAQSYIREAYDLMPSAVREATTTVLNNASCYPVERDTDELGSITEGVIPRTDYDHLMVLWRRLCDQPFDAWVNQQSDLPMLAEEGQQAQVDHAGTAADELLRVVSKQYTDRLRRPMYVLTVHRAVGVCLVFQKVMAYTGTLKDGYRESRRAASTETRAGYQRRAEDARTAIAAKEAHREVAYQRLLEGPLLNSYQPPAPAPSPSVTPPKAASYDGITFTASEESDGERHKFTQFAALSLQLENCRHQGYRIGTHPRMVRRTPITPLDCLPPELAPVLRDAMIQYEKLDKIVDAVLDNTTKTMSVAQAQEYRMATDTYGAKLLSKYAPGALEIALQILPYPVVRLYSILRINGRNDTKPFTEEWFRRRIEECSVNVTRSGRPLWRPLLKVIYENKRKMLELGIAYDVQTAIAAILKVVRDVPRANNPMFGQAFTATIEKMDERLLERKYDEATKTSSDPNDNWYQALVTGLVDAIAKEEERLSAHSAEPNDDLPSISQAEAHRDRAVPVKSRPEGAASQICVRHAIGDQGCRFGTEQCHFRHVDFDSLSPQDRAFVRTFLKDHRGPMVLDAKKARALGIKSTGVSDKLRTVNPELAAVTPNRGHGRGRVRAQRKNGNRAGPVAHTAIASVSAAEETETTVPDTRTAQDAPTSNRAWLRQTSIDDLLTEDERRKVAKFDGEGDRRAMISMLLRED